MTDFQNTQTSSASSLAFYSYKLQRSLDSKELWGLAAGMEEAGQLQHRSRGSRVVRKGQQQLAKQENLVLGKPPTDTVNTE